MKVAKMNEQEKRFALAAGIVMAIDGALRLATPAEILDENSPIRDGIREFMEMIAGAPYVPNLPCPVCGAEAIHKVDILERVQIVPPNAQAVGPDAAGGRSHTSGELGG